MDEGHETTAEKDEVESEDWYHGILSRKEVCDLIEKKGDWLCRATDVEGQTRFCVSVMDEEGHLRHLIVCKDKDGFFFVGGSRHKSPLMLILHHAQTQEMVVGCVLREAVKKKKRKWEVASKLVKREKKIGEGNFGEVWSGTLAIQGRTIPVAIKTLKPGAHESRDEFMKEVKTMLLYRHNNLVRLIAVAMDLPPAMLIMENCPGGGLDHYLKENKDTTTVSTKIRYCYEAACGMEYLAEKKQCVHRDVAARNCLLGVGGVLKIADFGLTRKGTYKTIDHTRPIPIKWTAPDAIQKATFSKQTDVWSFGVLMWEIFMDAEEPWQGYLPKEAYKAMKRGEQMKTPPGMPAELEGIMRSCWRLNAWERPTMTPLRESIQQHVKDPVSSDHGALPPLSRSPSSTNTPPALKLA